MATSRNKCHPFGVKQWCFLHNGQAGGHGIFRQKLEAMIQAEFYDHLLGATGREAIFLIALGEGLDDDPIGAMAALCTRLRHWSAKKRNHRICALRSFGQMVKAFLPRAMSRIGLYIKPCEDGLIASSEPLNADNDDWQ